ncbi:MAG: hypothetical protein IKW80_07195 [Thermoguttaceae bacterium]|nr:hypothetical protein [Thermoguttaceae bacterium]
MAKNLWILTEERPKKETLKTIFKLFAQHMGFGFLGNGINIIPLLDKDKCFSFTYRVTGFECAKVKNVFIKTVSGFSSFVDYLIFYQDAQPNPTDVPIFAIEETKTDDKESRNTGVYQRASKFVFLKNYYPKTNMVMLYSLQVEQKKRPTKTYIFGTRLLRTIGVEICGKELDDEVLEPFHSVDEIIDTKNSMRKPNRTNTPIQLKKTKAKIQISGRLIKNNSLGHDPNIGAISLIAAALRTLGWDKKIEVIKHGLNQEHVGNKNKFIQLANLLGVSLEGLKIPNCSFPEQYWYYDISGEKLGTIFLHTVVESFTESYSIFENHAGCEKSYFQTSDGQYIALEKYTDRQKYKSGDKTAIIAIPDLVLIDINDKEFITVEGKVYKNRAEGIRELSNYDSFEKLYLKKYYKKEFLKCGYQFVRTVVLYGSKEEQIIEVEVGFLLNEKGKLVLGIKAPPLFQRAIQNLLDYWK